MAHYAMIDRLTNVVTEVFVGRDENDLDDGMTSWEDHYSSETHLCLRTSYNTYRGVHLLDGVPFRFNYAGVGYTYHVDKDAFIEPQPEDDWTFDEDNWVWIPPPNTGEPETVTLP